jgi:hypothetical protein
MKFLFSDHCLFQRKEERKISKKLAKLVYSKAKKRYFDIYTKHHVAVAKVKHVGRSKMMMVAYDIIGDEIWIITAYPLKEKEIENRVQRGRWILKNEKN